MPGLDPEGGLMRIAIGALFTLMVLFVGTPAKADPYRWCAVYGSFGGGGVESCWYLTIEQCRAAVSGIGGVRKENGLLDSPPRAAERPPPRCAPQDAAILRSLLPQRPRHPAPS